MRRAPAVFLATVAAGLLAQRTGAADDHAYWEQRLPNLENPAQGVRPKVRARATDANLIALAQAGFGGVEVGIDWSLPPAQAREQLHELLQTARRVGLQLDLAPGGAQPYQSVGVSEAGSMQQLVTVSETVAGGTQYAKVIQSPARLPGHPTLVAVTAARVAVHAGGDTVVLDPGTAIDLTGRLTSSHELHWSVPAGQWTVFAFWQRATGQIPSRIPFEDPTVWSSRVPHTEPGRPFTADIFSATGIRGALDYLDHNLLPGNAELLRGADLAQDSLELEAEMFWTGDLPAEFQRRRGYSLISFLPALYTPREASFNPLDPHWGGPLPPRPFDFSGDLGARVRYDYQKTLTELYSERYLQAFTDWSHSRGLHSRVQVAYNYYALDVLRSSRAVDIPENESFDPAWARPFDPSIAEYGTNRWRHAMDSYRLTGSGAHLGGAGRATLEFGDDFALYRKQPLDYARQLNEALAGGITQGVMTGFASADTAWPTPQGGAAIGLGDDWTAGWPQWDDWLPLTRYFARSTQLLESGQPRVDVAIYHDKGLATAHDDAPLFAGTQLETSGFSFDFVDPDALVRTDAAALWGRVGYRALILDEQSAIPAPAARAILAMARAGLPVIIVGQPPQQSVGLLDSQVEDASVQRSFAQSGAPATLIRVATSDAVAAALKRAGVLPTASFGAESPLLSVHRHSDDYDLWWVFNPTGRPVAATATFAARPGIPYVADLWSGAISPIAQWTTTDQRTVMPLELGPYASTVILIRTSATPVLHVTACSSGRAVREGSEILLLDARGEATDCTLSDGKPLKLGTELRSLDLSRWRVEVEETSPTGPRHHDLEIASLVDWRSIAELRDAVGRATYSTTFDLPSGWAADSSRETILSVGDVAGAMQLKVNGHPVTEQTTGFGRWAVGGWLHTGTNTITVRLDTTLLNRMVALRAAGEKSYQTGPTPLQSAPSGLLGPVTLSSVPRLVTAGLE